MSKIFKLILFLVLIFVLVFFVYWKRNIFSKEKIVLEILGPQEATPFEQVEYTVRVKNNGNFRLEDPSLIFIAPNNSLQNSKFYETERIDEEKFDFALNPGEEKIFNFQFQILGQEGEKKIVKALFTYKPKNLKATYQSETSFVTVLKSLPIAFNLELPPKIPISQSFSIKINYFSNLDFPISDLRCQIEYPAGFEFISSYPKGLEPTEWQIPILNPNEGGRIEIIGKVSGKVGEGKIFKVKLGLVKEGKFILLKTLAKGGELSQTTVFLRQEINGNPRYVASPGEWLHYEIYFKNVGNNNLTNLVLFSKLEGEAFDLTSVHSEDGNFSIGDNTLVFDWQKVPQLQYLPPLSEGKVEFWVRVRDDIFNLKDPLLRNVVFVGEVREEFVNKIASKLECIQNGFYFDEVFGNSGPIPPVVGSSTTYTINWQVKNPYSDVKEVKLRGRLPDNVQLTGQIFPQEETPKFTFDSASREIVWNIGDVEKGLGITKPPKSIFFQVSIIPREDQRGKEAILMDNVEIEYFDSWAEITVKNRIQNLTTNNLKDPNLSKEMGIVQ
jgi:hypothetical protein